MLRECVFCRNPIGETATFCPKCGELNLLKEKYRITRKLGQGGFGVVYEANDLHLTRRYAVKVIKSESVAAQQAVKSEANIHAQYARTFPFMPEIYDIVELGTRTALVMEYIEGKTLEDLLAEQGAWSVPEVEQFLTTMLGYLAELHDVGLVHRDIKPANIKCRGNHRYVLLDFGIAKQQQLGSTLTGAKALSMFYSSPEQMKGQPTDARSDLYSLGATAYHLLAGLPLPSADVREQSGASFPLPRQLALTPDAPLAVCLRRMLELQPEARPLNARVALSILQGDSAPPVESSAGMVTIPVESPVVSGISPPAGTPPPAMPTPTSPAGTLPPAMPTPASPAGTPPPAVPTPGVPTPPPLVAAPPPSAAPVPPLATPASQPGTPSSAPLGVFPATPVVADPGTSTPKVSMPPEPDAPPPPQGPSIHEQPTARVPPLQQRKHVPQPQSSMPAQGAGWPASPPQSPMSEPEQPRAQSPRREPKQYIPPIHPQRPHDWPSRERGPERNVPRHEPATPPYDAPQPYEPPQREPSWPYEPPRHHPAPEQQYPQPPMRNEPPPYDTADTPSIPLSASLQQWWRTWGFWFWWVLATTLGAGVGLGIAVPIGGIAVTYLLAIPFRIDPLVISALSGTLVGIVFGAVIGFPQWFVLRRRLRRSGWWLLASAMGLIVGGGLLLSSAPQPLAIGATIGTIAGVAMGTTAGRYLEHTVNTISGGILMVLFGAGIGGGMAATHAIQNLAMEMGVLYGALVGFMFFWLLRGILAMIGDDEAQSVRR